MYINLHKSGNIAVCVCDAHKHVQLFHTGNPDNYAICSSPERFKLQFNAYTSIIVNSILATVISHFHYRIQTWLYSNTFTK